MSPRRRLARRVIKSFTPIIVVLVLALVLVTVAIVHPITYGIARPPRAPYLVTPQTFTLVGGPIPKATEVTWANHDSTKARGWLILGTDSSPAVILLHRYGTDRSLLLNLAVKLNETTNFTVLVPDLRGHGENPPVNWTLFGSIEGDDATAAIDYLHTLRATGNKPQISSRIGLYGVELGAYSALAAASHNPEVRALVLDSAPASPDDLVRAATSRHAAMNNAVLQRLARWGVRIYSLGKFQNTPSCDLARSARDEHVLLLTGEEEDSWRASTLELARCFNFPVDVKKDLELTGVNLPSATGEQEESYDRPVIDFFDKALRSNP